MRATRRHIDSPAAFALRALATALALCLTARAAEAKVFGWKATGQNGGVVYLVGSIHVLTPDFYPLNPALDAAFKDADLLVEEVDMAEMLDPAAQLKILSRGMLPGDQSLDKLLSPSTLALVKKVTGDLGAAGQPLMRFKPWMLAIVLQGLELQKAGYDPELGLDKHFYDQAKVAGKSVQGLETAEYQISVFDSMTMEQQDRMLAQTLKELETELASVGKLADAWKSGDSPTVERIVQAELKAEPQMYQRLLVDRNRGWLPKIEALFTRRGHALVVVGAAHLVGPDGIIAMLKAKGYTVEQL
jgi:uncharacterized protein YbaP (TraB family)